MDTLGDHVWLEVGDEWIDVGEASSNLIFTSIVGCVEPHTDIRLFAVHRMSDGERLTSTVNKPDNFSFQQYIQDGGLHFTSGNTLSLVANVQEGTARVLAESPLSHDPEITETPDGFKLYASVSNSWQLKGWIMSQGDSVEIIEPLALRQDIKKQLENTLARY